MGPLLVSAVVYLFGIAVVLYQRPRFMFHEDGRWKEFGLKSEDHTLAPFWLFCIVWAILSQGLSLLFEPSPETALATVAAAAPVVSAASAKAAAAEEMAPPTNETKKKKTSAKITSIQNSIAKMLSELTATKASFEDEDSDEEVVVPKPKKKRASMEMKPGYQMLDTEETRETGIPKQIFLGSTPPETSSVSSE